MFQRRIDGSVNFYLNWSDYKHGFGDLTNEFWLGNDKIHRLTSDDNKTLRVDLEDFEGNTRYAEYDKFGVMSESDKYKLVLGSYSGAFSPNQAIVADTTLLLKRHPNFGLLAVGKRFIDAM